MPVFSRATSAGHRLAFAVVIKWLRKPPVLWQAFLKNQFYFMCVSTLSPCMSVYNVCVVSTKARRGRQTPSGATVVSCPAVETVGHSWP